MGWPLKALGIDEDQLRRELEAWTQQLWPGFPISRPPVREERVLRVDEHTRVRVSGGTIEVAVYVEIKAYEYLE